MRYVVETGMNSRNFYFVVRDTKTGEQVGRKLRGFKNAQAKATELNETGTFVETPKTAQATEEFIRFTNGGTIAEYRVNGKVTRRMVQR
jgi:hypothetical protein